MCTGQRDIRPARAKIDTPRRDTTRQQRNISTKMFCFMAFVSELILTFILYQRRLKERRFTQKFRHWVKKMKFAASDYAPMNEHGSSI